MLCRQYRKRGRSLGVRLEAISPDKILVDAGSSVQSEMWQIGRFARGTFSTH